MTDSESCVGRLLLTREEAAFTLGMSPRSLDTLRAEGLIVPRKVRTMTRYHLDDIREFARSLPRASSGRPMPTPSK